MGRTQRAMEAIIYWHGKISDTSYIWFPYTFLRPAPQERISLVKATLLMAPLWGLYMGLPYGLYFIYAQGWKLADLGIFVAKFTLFFALWFNTVTRPLWNARANRLNSNN